MATNDIETELRHRIERVLDDGRERDVFRGAIAAVGTSAETVCDVATGTETIDPNGQPITSETRFDVASLTKPVATTTVAMRLVEDGVIDLDASLARYVPPLEDTARGDIPIRALLTHTSGLPPYKSFPFGWGSRDELLRSLYDSPISLLADPGDWFVYSDLNFVHLADALRRRTGTSLASLVETHLVNPLGLTATRLGPLEATTRVAVTRDRRWRDRVLRGEIHDYIGAVMEGEGGNAGLFTTCEDLARVARMLLDDGRFEGKTVLKPSTVTALRTDAIPDIVRPHGLGWRLAYEGQPAQTWSAESFGHTGFTGTSLWMDPAADRFAVLLTTHLASSERKSDIEPFRRRFHSLVGDVFERHHHSDQS